MPERHRSVGLFTSKPLVLFEHHVLSFVQTGHLLLVLVRHRALLLRRVFLFRAPVGTLLAAGFILRRIRIRVRIGLRLGLHGGLPVLLVFLLVLLPSRSVFLRRLALNQADSGHRAVDGQRADQVEVVHADQVQQEVAAQVMLDNVRAVLLGEQQAGLVHLVVSDEAGKDERGGDRIIPLSCEHTL